MSNRRKLRVIHGGKLVRTGTVTTPAMLRLPRRRGKVNRVRRK